MKNLEKAQIVYCNKCDGVSKCDFCHSRKYYLEIGNNSIYFEKDFSKSAILMNQIKAVVNIILNSILGLFGVIGIISLFFHVYEIISSGAYVFLMTNWLGAKMLVFYFGILCLMFLFYKLQVSLYVKENVIEFSSSSKKHKSWNSYNAFSRPAKKILFDAHYLAQTGQLFISSELKRFLA